MTNIPRGTSVFSTKIYGKQMQQHKDVNIVAVSRGKNIWQEEPVTVWPRMTPKSS